jgi:hypothetical protein
VRKYDEVPGEPAAQNQPVLVNEENNQRKIVNKQKNDRLNNSGRYH